MCAPLCLVAAGIAAIAAGCRGRAPTVPHAVAEVVPIGFELRGAWLAPRHTAGLDSPSATGVLDEMHDVGVRWVAVGHDVSMPKIAEPELEWGTGDAALRHALRSIHANGMQSFLLPRIESPDFFEPPYPFRADISFESDADWERFHSAVEQMLVHYAKLAAEEGVGMFGVGLELKRSVKQHGPRWRTIIERVRSVFGGRLTYSANWYDEWQDVPFWDALDYVGIGAYFELEPVGGIADPVGEIAARWTPILAELERCADRLGKPILFTEVGYAGYADCVERPWEWAGKQDRGVAVDHARQADAYAGMFRALTGRPWLAGVFVWTYYTGPSDIRPWEYALQGRPAERVLRAAYR